MNAIPVPAARQARLKAGHLPPAPGGGTYVLWLHLGRPRRIAVGRLGTIAFCPGHYGYVGSAQGPGGLAARVGRHLRGGGRPRWHIDYLRRAAVPTAVWLCASPRRWEHEWAAALVAMPGACLPAPGFGASDCRCAAHLIGLPHRPPPEAFIECLDPERGGVPDIVVVASRPICADDFLSPLKAHKGSAPPVKEGGRQPATFG